MISTIRAVLCAALLSAGLVVGVSSPAAAAPLVVSYSGSVVTVAGTSADEQINIRVTDTHTGEPGFSASPAGATPAIQAGPGCTTDGPAGVKCITGDWPTVRVTMGYGEDEVTLTTNGMATGTPQPSGRTYIDTGANNDIVRVGAGTQSPRADIALGSGNDHFVAPIKIAPREVTVDGGPGTDQLDGSPQDDFLDGGSGNDTISGGLGSDSLNGDSGNDTISGGNGQDLILGDYGTDDLNGGSGKDTIYGGYGNDTLSGGADTGELPAGGDELRGNSGADVITSGNRAGAKLFGGEGIDSLNAQNAVVDQVINCGESTSDKAKADPGEELISCEKPLP
jgi:Ca2+-binding RTX toxin-like protein